MKHFTFNLDIKIVVSYSKIMALVVFIGGFINGNPTVISIAIVFGTGLVMGKQYFDSYFNSPKGKMPIITETEEQQIND